MTLALALLLGVVILALMASVALGWLAGRRPLVSMALALAAVLGLATLTLTVLAILSARLSR